MTTTTTEHPEWDASRPLHLSPTLDLWEANATAIVAGTASPWAEGFRRAVGLLCDLVDVATVDQATAALGRTGARDALVASLRVAQHGDTWSEVGSDEGDGTIAVAFAALVMSTLARITAEDHEIASAGVPRGTDEPWRQYAERSSRLVFVRALRAIDRSNAGPSASDALYRVPGADDPFVTAPRAQRAGRSPGSKVIAGPHSRSERQSVNAQRAADVWASEQGAGPDTPDGVPALLGTRYQMMPQRIVADPECHRGEHEGECDVRRCWLGGWHSYEGKAGISWVWRPVQGAPHGVLVRRDHATGVLTDAMLPGKVKTRLAWSDPSARQYLAAVVGKRSVRLTPSRWRSKAGGWFTPTRTAQAIAGGATIDPAVITTYGDVRWVGHQRADVRKAPSQTRTARARRDKVRRTLSVQHKAILTLIVDAALLTMLDGRSRQPHPGYVVANPQGVLSLVTPAGITSPLRTDPRGMTADIRTAITA